MTLEDQFQFIVEEVIRRLTRRMGEPGRDEKLIVVFTGATVGLVEGVRQVRSLLSDGFRIELIFSRAAEHLLAEVIKKEFGDFPELGMVSPEKWLSSLKEASGVAVPMLSLNTVSKLSLLIADDLVSNILLHALLMGKPLVMAKDGADPDSEGRRTLGFHKGNAALRDAMKQRMRTLQQFGCILTTADQLANSVRSAVGYECLDRTHKQHPFSERILVSISGQVATAGDVLSAHQRGADLNLGPAALVTPLARDLARLLGVDLISAGSR
jgi:hypothetical protein